MAFVKTHWISLLSGVLIVAFVVFGTLTMSSTPVKAEMTKRLQETGANNIGQLIREPHGRDAIEAKKKESKELDTEYNETIAKAQNINKREPLMVGVFPKPEDASVTPLRFRDAYQDAFIALTRTPALAAGTAPTAADIADQQADIEDLVRQEKQDVDETKVTDRQPAAPNNPQPPPPAPTPPQPTGRGIRSVNGLAPGSAEGGRPAAYGQQPPVGAPAGHENEPKYNPTYRARIAKAKAIRCYAEPNAFHLSPIVGDKEHAPIPADMWYAQVGLWIQKDVVDAVAELNAEAASKIGDGEGSVESSPVKRIVGIQVQGYVLPSKAILPFPRWSVEAMLNPNMGSSGSSGPSVDLSPSRSFSARSGNEQYDVVRLTVALVADQRDLVQFVDRLSKKNFYLCTHMRYDALDRDQQEQQGYVYGTDPVVLTTMDFECYLARDVYEKMMPDAVRVALGMQAAQPQQP